MKNPRDTTSSPRAGKVIDSPVGSLFLTATDDGLTHVTFAESSGDGPRGVPGTGEATRVLRETERQLGQYFAGRRRKFDLPLAPAGTEFQLATWTELTRIPYGETISYGELARRIGRPRAVRAVGAANGANPISVIVPCHRVIGADGTLVGYGGGLAIKRHLLSLEGHAIDGELFA